MSFPGDVENIEGAAHMAGRIFAGRHSDSGKVSSGMKLASEEGSKVDSQPYPWRRVHSR